MKIATIGLRHTWTPGTLGTLGTIGSLAKIGYLIFIGTETDFLKYSWNVLDFDTKKKMLLVLANFLYFLSKFKTMYRVFQHALSNFKPLIRHQKYTFKS